MLRGPSQTLVFPAPFEVFHLPQGWDAVKKFHRTISITARTRDLLPNFSRPEASEEDRANLICRSVRSNRLSQKGGQQGPSPFEPGPLYLTSWSNYFLTFAFLARAADP
jgi:hypothetical protein